MPGLDFTVILHSCYNRVPPPSYIGPMYSCRLILVSVLFSTTAFAQPAKLVVHEWGTFTCLQDPDGKAIGGINIDDEPLPAFVYDEGLIHYRSVPRGKGLPRLLPDVTMRLETPVLYFYPSTPKVDNLRVEVSFQNGWLTQFFPKAQVENAGFKSGKIAPGTAGTLIWEKLSIAGMGDGPSTTSKIWLAPRAVDAASVTTESGERERYLFYRGAGKLDAPVKVVRSGDTLAFQIENPWRGKIPGVYLLADFRQDGLCAFRSIATGGTLPSANSRFEESEYTRENRQIIRQILRKMLIDDGLFPKEAEAMLNTWEHSYFDTPGLRLFFLAPKAWTDEVLPLQISVESEVSRVMIGRVELIRPDQLALLQNPLLIGSPLIRPKLGRFAESLVQHYLQTTR